MGPPSVSRREERGPRAIARWALPLVGLGFLVLSGCQKVVGPKPDDRLQGFTVKVDGVFQTSGQAANVIPACANQYGGQAAVPSDTRGQRDCPYAISTAPVDVKVEVQALDGQGKQIDDLDRPVAFRVVPGDLTAPPEGTPDPYSTRWAQLSDGKATATVRIEHVSGDVNIWAEDSAPVPIFLTDGGVAQAPPEPDERTHAAGVSDPIHFEPPTLAKIQFAGVDNNTASPFIDQFMDIGLDYQRKPVLQSCADPGDPNDGQPVTMVVTGINNSGFYLTDLTACRMVETSGLIGPYEMPEPDGFFPGTFGSVFIYNYSYPEDLVVGDVLRSVTGSVAEFTSSTQITFDSYSIEQDVSLLPPDQQDQWLSQVPVPTLNLRDCGLSNAFTPYFEDVLCAFNKGDMKVESLESALVRIDNVRFPSTFANCDYNGDGQVPFFCGYGNDWHDCGDGILPDSTCENQSTPGDLCEERCNIDCTIGQGPYAGKLCSESSSYHGFSQFSVEMADPGPAEAGLDDSLPARIQDVAVSSTAAHQASPYAVGDTVHVWCDVDAHVHYGDVSTPAQTTDPLLPAKTLAEYTFTATGGYASFVTDGATGTCAVAQETHTRVLVGLQDSVPELNVDCNPNAPDPDQAQQCRDLKGATYDIVGILKQVEPARPRWQVVPESVDSICCHPGPGLSCPEPISPCP